MRTFLICSILALGSLVSAPSLADCVPAATAGPDADCVVGVQHGDRRGVWATVTEYDVLTRRAADARELTRQVTILREAYQERIAQVDALQRAVAEQREATAAADTLAAAERLRADGAEEGAAAERERAAAWYRSPVVGFVLGAGAVLAGGAVVLVVTR